jgi:sugar/nucleoside kinase (ribokinase family)
MKPKPTSTRCGLLAGGTWIVDQVKLVDALPHPHQSAILRSVHTGTGGSSYNILLTLALSGVSLPLLGAGLVGKDEAGAAMLADCKKHKIDTKHLTASPKAATAFTDRMTEAGTGRQLHFHSPGAGALWTGDDLNFARLKVKWFHLGGLGLLDALAAADAKFGSKAARLLAAAQEAGVKTSVDLAGVSAERLAQVVPPALKFADYLITSETKAGLITGFKVREPGGKLDTVTLRHATGALLQQGVREMVILHFPEGAFARTRRGEDVWQSSVKLPPKLIAGTAGAGDAFCAGCLLGLNEGWETRRSLETAVCLAAASLGDPTATGGVGSLSTSLALGKKYRFHPPLEPGDF